MRHLVLLMVAIAAGVARAKTSTPEGWTDDYDAALRWATAQNKLVLADFSGSDWCGWCKKLDKEVFDTDEFRAGAKDKYILLMIDTPRDQSLLSETAKKQNPGLVEKYRVEGFPTVLLLDAKGEVLFRTGYEKGGPVKYLKMLDEEVKFGPDIKKYIKPIEDVLNRYDDEMQKEMEVIKDKVEETYPEVSTNQPLIRLRREQKRRERKMTEMAKRMMFEKVFAKYIPLYDKAFAEAKEMKVPAHMEVRKLELINGQERNFQAMKMAKAQYDLEAAKRKAKGAADEEDEKPPTDGKWHGLDWADVWAESVRTNAALPTAWKYFTEQFRPYVRRNLLVPEEGQFAKEMQDLADQLALALWNPESGGTFEYRMDPVLQAAWELSEKGCSNLTVQVLAKVADYWKMVKPRLTNGRMHDKAVTERTKAYGRWLKEQGGLALASHLYGKMTHDDDLLAHADRELLSALTDHPKDLRVVYEIIGCPAVTREKGVDPWFACMADAESERLKAWKARGGGFASSVSEEGWKNFREHLGKAREFAERAYELHPEVPESAALVLRIVAPECDGGEKDRWLDAVLQVEVDNADAWGTYRFHSLPRWGGTIEGIRILADAQWDTQRFDSLLPCLSSYSLRIVDEENRLAGGKMRSYTPCSKDPELRVRCLKGLESVACGMRASLSDVAIARQTIVKVLWEAGNWEEAARRKRELLDKCPRQYVSQSRRLEEPVVLVLSALDGAHAKEIIALERFCIANMDGRQEIADDVRAKAAELLKPLTKNMSDLTAAERKLVVRRKGQICVAEAGADGWVEIKFAEGLPGWKPYCGKAKFAGGAYELPNAQIDLANPLPADYEVEVEFQTRVRVEFQLDNKYVGEDENGLGIGRPMVCIEIPTQKSEGTDPWFSVCSAFWNGKKDREGKYYSDHFKWRVERSKTARQTARIAVRGNAISVWLNGKAVLEDSDLLKKHFKTNRRGCVFGVGGCGAKVFKVRYRKLAK